MSAEQRSKPLLKVDSLVQKNIYQSSLSAAELAEEFAELKNYDKFVEKRGKAWGVALLFIILVLGFGLNPAGPISLTILVPLVIFTGYKWIHWSNKNLADERYLLGERLLELFSRDMADDAPVGIKLDFGPLRNKANQFGKRRDRTVYKSDWLTVSGAFADGSKFALRVSEIMHVKFRKGKIKNKGLVVSLTVAFSKKSYGVLQIDRMKADKLLQLRGSGSLKSLRIKGNVINLSAKVPPNSEKADRKADELSLLVKMLLLSSYAIMRSGRAQIEKSAS